METGQIKEQETKVADRAESIVLFDGVCGLCDHFVQIVLKNDPQGKFQFAPLQSSTAKNLLARHGKDPAKLSSVYLIQNQGSDKEKLFERSEAALRVLGALEGPIHWLRGFLFVPGPLRDLGYDLVAANRYKIFGKHESCRIPSPEERSRFIDD